MKWRKSSSLPSTNLVWCERTCSQPSKGDCYDPDLRHTHSQRGSPRWRMLSQDEIPNRSSRGYNSIVANIKHAMTMDNSDLPNQCQTSRDSTFRPLSLTSVADSEVEIGQYIDDDEVLRRISRLLRSPVTSASEQFTGPDGKPLGVEVAINAYQRGEYSTHHIDQDLLPQGLQSHNLDCQSLCDHGDEYATDPNGFPDLGSLYATATDRKSIALSEIESLLKDSQGAESDMPKLGFHEPQYQPKTSGLSPQHSQQFFNQLIENIHCAAKLSKSRERFSNGDGECQPPSTPQAGHREQLSDTHSGRPAYNFSKASALGLQLRGTSDKSILSPTRPSPRPLPIDPEALEDLRRLLPQPCRLSPTLSCDSDQSHIHPALRTSIAVSPLQQSFEDQFPKKSGFGPCGPSVRNKRDSPLSAKTSDLDDLSGPPSASTSPTSVSGSPQQSRSQCRHVPQCEESHPCSTSLRESRDDATESKEQTSPSHRPRLLHSEYTLSTLIGFAPCNPPHSTKGYKGNVINLREKNMKESCPNDSSYSLRRMLAEDETDEEIEGHIDAAAQNTIFMGSPFLPTCSVPHKTQKTPARKASASTMMGGCSSDSPAEDPVLTIPRYALSALRSEKSITRKRFALRPISSSMSVAADETYQRAQTYLLCQRPPPPRGTPSPKSETLILPQRPTSHTSRKLSRFFGDDYTRLATRDQKAVEKEHEHSKMVQNLLGGSKRPWSGVSKDVKKGLKRLFG